MATVELKNKILKYLIEHATESTLSFDKNQLAKRHSMGQGQMSRILTELAKNNLINIATISDMGGTRCTITATGYEFHEAGGYKSTEEVIG
jgi:CTP-dependent riboflavin kinase